MRNLETKELPLRSRLSSPISKPMGPETALAVGLFGLAALGSGPLQSLEKNLKPHQGALGCGGGCGGGGCGGGCGGCGGCGG